MVTSLMKVPARNPVSKRRISARDPVSYTHICPVAAPETNSRPWRSTLSPVAEVRPSAPPGRNTSSVSRPDLPRKMVPSALLLT
jgi:hypothetical protein